MADLDDKMSSPMGNMWQRLGAAARATLVTGIILCAASAALVLWWAMRTDYQVLFSNLEPSDAAAVIQALKAQKVSYHIENQGRTITVPADHVYETRLALMSSGTPLTGGVGFEIFDRQGLGETEESQRIAYQRALQGELSRTIGALEHVRQAHVLLVLPESTIFRRDQQKARASVSITLEPGTHLQDDQILGVQRLVAASVSGLDVDQVVITDQRGVTLSSPGGDGLQSASSGARLKLKSDFEEYFTQKISTMLEHVVGPGKAIVSVNATLNFDQVTRSMQLLVPLNESDPDKGGGVLHRRETHDHVNSTGDSAAEDNKKNTNSSLEVDYEYGKKIEQVAAAPGALVRLTISVIVPGSMTTDREAHLLELIKAAAGTDEKRGDVVVLDSLDRIASPDIAADEVYGRQMAVTNKKVEPSDAIKTVAHAALPTGKLSSMNVLLAAGLLLVVLAFAGVIVVRRQDRLSTSDREKLLAEIVTALQTGRTDRQSRI
ncbi:MAG: flagellar basal-body MS-ring/collar protein FliF [Steroidobacter sp.]